MWLSVNKIVISYLIIIINGLGNASQNPPRNPSLQAIAFWAMSTSHTRNGCNFSINIPSELICLVHEFMVNDWTRLKLAFPNRQVHVFVNFLRRKYNLFGGRRAISWNGLRVEWDNNGHIVMIDFRRHGLSHCNVSELPPRLRYLALQYGYLTRFDLTKLPKGLQKLDISNHRLSYVDLSQLPVGLRLLQLSFNCLKTLDLYHLPEGLKELHIACNDLIEVDFSHCPKGLRVVSMGGNLIQNVIFGKGTVTIFGAYERRGELKYMGDDIRRRS